MILVPGWFLGRSRLPSWSSVGASVEALQHGVVGPLEQPLLAQGGGVTGVHEDAALAGAAVDAAVADRVEQTLILQSGGEEGGVILSAASSQQLNSEALNTNELKAAELERQIISLILMHINEWVIFKNHVNLNLI